jgi:hypothetical protein
MVRVASRALFSSLNERDRVVFSRIRELSPDRVIMTVKATGTACRITVFTVA